MTGTEIIMSEEEFKAHLIELVQNDCTIAEDTQLEIGEIQYITEKTIARAYASRLTQLFLKSPQFSKSAFHAKWVDNIHMGRIYMVDQLAGDGHLTVLSSSFASGEARCVRVGVSYSSFFVLKPGCHIGPSDDLKSFYHDLVRKLKKGTQKLTLWKGYNVWVKKNIAEDKRQLEKAIRILSGFTE
jgi:hypothetical protein